MSLAASDKHLAEILYEVLNELPWPYYLQHAPGTDEIYLTAYMLAGANLAYASGAPRRAEQVAQVSIYSTRPVVTEIADVCAALRAAGLKISQAGAQGYDSTTHLYHAPIIVRRSTTTTL